MPAPPHRSARVSGGRPSDVAERERPKRVSAVTYTEASEDEDAGELNVDELDASSDGEGELEEEEDAEWELEIEEEDEGEVDEDEEAEGEVDDLMEVDDDDAEGEEDEEAEPAPPTKAPAVKLRFTVGGSSTSPSITGSGAGMGRKHPTSTDKRAKHVHIQDGSTPVGRAAGDIYSDDSDEDLRRSTSPSKLTARQRAKGNKDLQETLVSLPEGQHKKALVLTEAEKVQRREENARKRKRQMEQRLQDEQDQTINRLLRAQTSKSRSKLDAPAPGTGSGGGGETSPAPADETPEPGQGPGQGVIKGQKRGPLARFLPVSRMMGVVRYVCRLESDVGGGGGVVNLVGVLGGDEGLLDLTRRG